MEIFPLEVSKISLGHSTGIRQQATLTPPHMTQCENFLAIMQCTLTLNCLAVGLDQIVVLLLF